MTKTGCGEVAVLVLVFPLLDWFIQTTEIQQREVQFRLIRWSPIVAIVFFVGAVIAAGLEKLFEEKH